MLYLSNRTNTNATAGKPTTSSFSPFNTIFIDRMIDGKETVALLEAPPISRKTQWKLRIFLHVEKKLLPKLKLYSAAALISVFGYHFGVNTHVTNDQPDTYIVQFERAFGDLRYLQPLGYFDTRGQDVTCNVQKSKPLPNLTYV